ncbi:MAG: DUF2252 domain-containing protein [Polyangiales bacterium]
MASTRLPLTPEERIAVLDAKRERKMMSSAHAYVRGSTSRFYKWLLTARGKSVPRGPAIWIGGDCHVGNLGPLAGAEGALDVQLRDLDQTVIGAPGHDVIRFALSMAMAVRASGLGGEVTLAVVEAIARGYETVLERQTARLSIELGHAPAALAGVMRKAGRRSRKDLFEERIGKNERLIPIGDRFWPLSDEERASVEELVESDAMQALAASVVAKPDDARVKLVDAAYWVKGCSSLGLFRCAALIEVAGGNSDGAKSLHLFDVKEALPPLAPRAKGARMPRHHGERVIAGARKLSPNLGDRMIPATVVKRPVFVRELRPQDLKFDLEVMDAKTAIEIGAYLGGVIGVAHGRQLEPADCAKWVAEFRKSTAKRSDAPAWLWAAVVDLVALHEGAYLEHCREHTPRETTTAKAVLEDQTVVSHHVDGES